MAAAAAPKVAVIVGCGSKHDKFGDAEAKAEEYPPTVRFGLGGALSLRFAAAGFHTVLCSRRQELLDAVSAEVAAAGGQSTSVVCDVTSDESVKAAFSKAREIGKVEVTVFNCAPAFPAAFGEFPLPAEVDPAFLTSCFDVGVSGCLRCAREVIPQ